jgi:hypothetical protein
MCGEAIRAGCLAPRTPRGLPVAANRAGCLAPRFARHASRRESRGLIDIF